MSRKIKLLILIILSLSVYFIYYQTSNKEEKIVIIGDRFSEGINSYGIKDYSYIDFYLNELKEKNIKIKFNNQYIKRDMSIFQMIDKIQTYPIIKRELLEANILIINIGYNDLIYELAIEKTLNHKMLEEKLNKIKNNYQLLLKEIRKYYKGKIIGIGYYQDNQEDYYKNIGIRKINQVLQESNQIEYIDITKLLKEKDKYFTNPQSIYPNQLAYQKIAQEIITKTLEK